jgi:hypothetical protein
MASGRQLEISLVGMPRVSLMILGFGHASFNWPFPTYRYKIEDIADHTQTATNPATHGPSLSAQTATTSPAAASTAK